MKKKEDESGEEEVLNGSLWFMWAEWPFSCAIMHLEITEDLQLKLMLNSTHYLFEFRSDIKFTPERFDYRRIG